MFDKYKSKDKKYIRDLIDQLKLENYDYIIDLHSKLLSRIIGKGIFFRKKYKISKIQKKENGGKLCW